MISWRFGALLLAYVVTSTGGLIQLRAQLRRDDVVLLSAQTLTNWPLIFGMVLYGLSFFLWLLAVSRFDLSTAYPFFIGVGYTSVTVLAVLVLDEPMSVTKAIGAALVGLGLIFVATG